MRFRGPLFVEAGTETGGGGGTLFAGGGDPAPPVVNTGSAAPPASPWFKDESGNFADGWQARLPDGLKDHPSLRALGSMEALAKSYVETKGLVGKKLEAPGPDATPEQLAAWRKVLGAPDKPEGYYGDQKSFRPDAVPEEAWDAETEKGFLALAHKHHLPPAAVKEIMSFYGESVGKGLAANVEASAATLQVEAGKLRTAWGKDYDSNLNAALRMAKTAGLDPATDPIFTNAATVQAFARMASLFSEDKLVTGGSTSIENGIAERIGDITNPSSQSLMAREYRGELGPERQRNAQTQLHALYEAQKAK